MKLDRLTRLQQKLGWKGERSLLEVDVDKNIYPLLLLMNLSGNQTFTSCGGHRNGRLVCWREDKSNPKIQYGGYIDFKPRDAEFLTILREFLELEFKFFQDTDVWLKGINGVGLEKDIPSDTIRLSWFFSSWRENTKFIEKLESFFIETGKWKHENEKQ